MRVHGCRRVLVALAAGGLIAADVAIVSPVVLAVVVPDVAALDLPSVHGEPPALAVSTAAPGPEVSPLVAPQTPPVPTPTVAVLEPPPMRAPDGVGDGSAAVLPTRSGVEGFVAGRSVEVVSLRDAVSSTYVNPDGTTSVVMSSMPVHYLDAGGVWQKIDNSVVVGADGVLTNAANAWAVRFDTMSPGRGVSFDRARGLVRLWAEGVDAVEPVVEPDGVSVRYADVARGVDLVYRVNGMGVEEFMVLKAPGATRELSFMVVGAEFDDAGGGLVQRGTGGLGLRVSPPETMTRSGEGLGRGQHVFTVENTPGGVAQRSRVRLGLTAGAVVGRGAADYPIVIDPQYVVSEAGWDLVEAYQVRRSTNTWTSTIADGWVRTGDPAIANDPSVRWRSVVSFPDYWVSDATIVDATLHTFVDPAWASTATNYINVYWADQYGPHTTANPRYYALDHSPYDASNNPLPGLSYSNGWVPYITSTPISSGDQYHSDDLHFLYNNWHARGQGEGALFLASADEVPGGTNPHDFKKYTVTLTLTFDRRPAAPTATVSTSGRMASFTVTSPTTDGDGQALYYSYRIYNPSQPAGEQFIDTGWTSATSWSYQMPQDWSGQTAYYYVYNYDGVDCAYTPGECDGLGDYRERGAYLGSAAIVNSPPGTPTLVSPANGLSTHSLTQTLTANAVTDPNGIPPQSLGTANADSVYYAFFYCTASPCVTKQYFQSWTLSPGGAQWWLPVTFPV